MADPMTISSDPDSTRDTQPPKRWRGSLRVSTDSVKEASNSVREQHQDLLEVSSDSGSSDSNDPVSRKARKLAIIMSKRQQPQPEVNNVNPLAYAMKYGKFPKPSIVPLENRQEPSELSDPGYLWNACPPRYCQYLDMEAEHQGSSSSGTTGSSEGSLSDPDFIEKDDPQEHITAKELQELQTLFPKTFKRIITK